MSNNTIEATKQTLIDELKSVIKEKGNTIDLTDGIVVQAPQIDTENEDNSVVVDSIELVRGKILGRGSYQDEFNFKEPAPVTIADLSCEEIAAILEAAKEE